MMLAARPAGIPQNATREESLPFYSAIGLGGLGLGAAIISFIFQMNATQYTERAGQILAKKRNMGGCDAHE